MLHNTLAKLGQDKSDHTIVMLGYSADHLKEHIEGLFKSGMSWDNYGEWEIDHIIPVMWFDKNALQSVVNALSNLQPLWWWENNEKIAQDLILIKEKHGSTT